MQPISCAQAEYQNKKKLTRCERFLAQTNTLMPWQRLIGALSPSYFPHSAGKRGRPPIGLEWMLRLYDVTMAGPLVRDDDKRVYGDAGTVQPTRAELFIDSQGARQP